MLLQLASLITAIVGALAVPVEPLVSYQSYTATAGQAVHSLPAGKAGSQLRSTPTITAQSAFLVDTASGTILHEQQADAVRPLASITKLMTALVLLERNPSWIKRITFEARDRRNGDITRLIPGEEITLREAWDLMLVGSSNDAAALLARVVWGSEEAAVEAMNARAFALGLRRTRFTDPTGLQAGNVGTAREVAVLARRALQYTEIREAVLKSSFQFAPKGKTLRKVQTTNQLLSGFRLPGVELFGGKTGHIEESGYNLVFAGGQGPSELIGVVLGSETNDLRFKDMATLMKWGFSTVRAGQPLGD